jgi:hypothetical protein
MSPELETLDQLLTHDMPVSLIASLYPTPDSCKKGLLGLLHEGDVVLLDQHDREVPQRRWRELFSPSSLYDGLWNLRLRITPQGAKKIG